MGEVEIRAMADADWTSFLPIFTNVVDAGESYAYPPGLTCSEARDLWTAAVPGRTVVAVDGDELLGSARMSPNRPGRGAHIATASFMVAPAARGRGLGRALGQHVIDWARASGYRGIQFNAVVETNEAAVRTWRALGFEIIGTVPGAFEHKRLGYVGLHVMYRRLP